MNVDEFLRSKYLGASDLNGKEPVVTISRISMENMRDGQRKVAIFINNHPKGILLNKTNTKAIAALYGKETDAWVGKRIKLVSVWTEYGGQPTQGLRIVPPGVDPTPIRGSAPGNAMHDWQASSSPPPATSADDFGARLEDEVPF